MRQVMVAATGLNPATAQMVGALQQYLILHKLVTTLAFPAGHWLPALWPRLDGRVIDVPAARLVTWPWPELLRLACSRLDRSGFLADRVWESLDHRFSRRSARYLQNADAVLGFEHSSLELFKVAKDRGISNIYNVPSAHSGLVRGLLAEQTAVVGAGKRLTGAIESRRQQRRDDEFAIADLVIAHSAFAKRSYADAGFDASKIVVIPLAAPPVPADVAQAVEPHTIEAAPVFLFAGNFALHKGAQVLLDAWRQADMKGARLLVAGDVYLPDAMLYPLPAGVELLGRVSWQQLQQLYRRCTALVLPSLSDGFGMVVTEALASGLPVITTPNTGASDLIRHGHNGLLVPVLDSSALAAAMSRMAQQPEQVASMKREAVATAASWQWQDFRLAFAQCIAGLQPRLDS